jgi:transcriptional regulator of met regulon
LCYLFTTELFSDDVDLFKNREDEIEQIRKQIQYDNLQETLKNKEL